MYMYWTEQNTRRAILLIGTIIVTWPQQTEAVNLALGKATKQSSTRRTNVAGLVVDGYISHSRNGKFVCAHTNNNAERSWWAVDLGDTYTISTIIIYGRTDCCPNQLESFDVDVIMDPNCVCDKWSAFQQGDTTNCYFQQSSTQFLNLTCPTNTNGRFVRIKNRGLNTLVLCEVEVYDFPILTAVNLALGKDTNQSSIWGNKDGVLAVNGEIIRTTENGTLPCSHTLDNDDRSWWAVDLGDIYTISTITIYGRTDCCSYQLENFDVDVITDPYCSCDKWATFQEGTPTHCYFQQNSTQFLNITCPTNTTGRFVRIKNRGHNRLVLCEVEVYGQSLTTITAPKTTFVKACGFVGKEYTGITIRSSADSSKLECVAKCINEVFCCGAEFNDLEKRCTLKSKAENIRKTTDFFRECQGTITFLLN